MTSRAENQACRSLEKPASTPITAYFLIKCSGEVSFTAFRIVLYYVNRSITTLPVIGPDLKNPKSPHYIRQRTRQLPGASAYRIENRDLNRAPQAKTASRADQTTLPTQLEVQPRTPSDGPPQTSVERRLQNFFTSCKSKHSNETTPRPPQETGNPRAGAHRRGPSSSFRQRRGKTRRSGFERAGNCISFVRRLRCVGPGIGMPPRRTRAGGGLQIFSWREIRDDLGTGRFWGDRHRQRADGG